MSLAATAVTILPGPACVHCKGGRVINGVPCLDCDGTGRQPAAGRRWRRLRGRLHGAADRLATPAGVAVRWSASLPGVGGAAAVTYGLAVSVHGVFHQLPALGVAAVVGGAFGILADRRL